MVGGDSMLERTCVSGHDECTVIHILSTSLTISSQSSDDARSSFDVGAVVSAASVRCSLVML